MTAWEGEPPPRFEEPAREWVVFARNNQTQQRIGEIDEYRKFEATVRHNDVGAWSLELDRVVFDRWRALGLDDPSFGIELVHRLSRLDPGTTVMSGLLDKENPKLTPDEDIVMVTGFDDNVLLRNRLASPQPGSSAPPYNSAAYDVRTGTASTIMGQFVNVNAGPGAVSIRAIPNLVIAADPVIGLSYTGRARWQTLLELLQEIALGSNLGFRLVKQGEVLEFQVYQPANRAETVGAAVRLGTMSEYDYSRTRPKTTFAIVAGGGEGTARIVREVQNTDELSRWGRLEGFVDQRDTTDNNELLQAGNEHLAENGEEITLAMTPIDIPGQRFGEHYDLSDTITVVVDDVTIAEKIIEVRVALEPDSWPVVTPVVGTPQKSTLLRMFTELRTLRQRVSNLERQ